MIYHYGNDDEDFLKYLEERVEINPSSSFFAMLSSSYLETDRIAEALAVAQRGVAAHPNYSTGHIVLAMAMMKARLFYDARKELAKARDLNPCSKIAENLAAKLDKEEQADEIGRKLAEQFQKNRAGGKDLMKTIEETIEAYRPKEAGEDLIIPGLDAIIGDEHSQLETQLLTPTLLPSQLEMPPKYPDLGQDKQEVPGMSGKVEGRSTIAKAIIEKVAREIESKSVESSDLREAKNESPLLQAESSTIELPPTEKEPITPEIPSSTYEPDEVEPDTSDFDLDSLARELEAAGPIKPNEDRPREQNEETGIELTPEIVTETLARIFEQQGQLKTAIEAYNILIQKKPEQAETYQKKIAELAQRTNG